MDTKFLCGWHKKKIFYVKKLFLKFSHKNHIKFVWDHINLIFFKKFWEKFFSKFCVIHIKFCVNDTNFYVRIHKKFFFKCSHKNHMKFMWDHINLIFFEKFEIFFFKILCHDTNFLCEAKKIFRVAVKKVSEINFFLWQPPFKL